MKSLMDVAKSMDSQQAKAAASTLSLVDIAKKQNSSGDASGSGAEKKPMTLMDVARQESASAVAKTQQQPSVPTTSLASLAQEINDEDNKRIESALTTTANAVEAEQRERQAAILKEAVAEVHQEETQAALNLVAKIERNSKIDPLATAAIRDANAAKDQLNSKSNQQNDTNGDGGSDADGYSSFGDDDDEEEEVFEKPPAKPSKTKKTQQLFDEENGSDRDGDSGPERTIASDTPESKAFLRAVYRADLRKIQDMLDTEEGVSATIADQWIDVVVDLQHGWSGLHWAASQGHTKILEFLLKQGAQVNVVDHVREMHIPRPSSSDNEYSSHSDAWSPPILADQRLDAAARRRSERDAAEREAAPAVRSEPAHPRRLWGLGDRHSASDPRQEEGQVSADAAAIPGIQQRMSMVLMGLFGYIEMRS